MKVISNPNAMLWFNPETDNEGIWIAAVRVDHITGEYATAILPANAAPQFVGALAAAIGRMSGVGATSFNGSGVDAIIDLQYNFRTDSFLIVPSSVSSTSSSIVVYTREQLLDGAYCDTDADRQLMSDLLDDIASLIQAPVPTSIPLSIPGRQMTIGRCVWWPTDNNWHFQVQLSSGLQYPTFRFNDSGNIMTVSKAQMSYILNILLAYGDYSGFTGWLTSDDEYHGYSAFETYYAGLIYNGSTVSGIEIMHSAAPSSTRPGSHQSMGILQNVSLAQYVCNAQAALSRALAALPVLDVTNQKLDSAAVDIDAIVAAILAGIGPSVDGIHSHLNGVQSQMTGEHNGITSSVTSTVNGQAEGLHTHLGDVQSQVASTTAAAESHRVTELAAVLTVGMATYRRLASAKAFNALLSRLGDMRYRAQLTIAPGDKLVYADEGPINPIFELLDSAGRLQSQPEGGNDDE